MFTKTKKKFNKPIGSGGNGAGLGSTASSPIDVNTDDIFQMEASFSGLDSESAVKYFMDVPEKPLIILLRSNIRNNRLLSHVVLAMRRYRKYSQTEHMQMLLEYLVGTRAIGGFATVQGLQVAVQIMAEQLMLHMTGANMTKKQQEQMKKEIDQQMQLKAGGNGSA